METAVENGDTTIARAKKGDTATTVQLFASTRDRLKALKPQFFGDESASFDDLLNELVDRVTGEGGELDENLAADLTARLERLEAVVVLLVEDPKNGYLFRADSGKVQRGVEGKAGEPRTGLFDSGNQHGAFVKAPSGEHLTERDDSLPEPVREFVKEENRQIEKAAALLAKKQQGRA